MGPCNVACTSLDLPELTTKAPRTLVMRHHVEQRQTEVAQDGFVKALEEAAVEHGIRAQEDARSAHGRFAQITSSCLASVARMGRIHTTWVLLLQSSRDCFSRTSMLVLLAKLDIVGSKSTYLVW